MNLQGTNELTEEDMEAVTGGNAFLGAVLGWAVGKILDKTFGGEPISIGQAMDWYRANSS